MMPPIYTFSQEMVDIASIHSPKVRDSFASLQQFVNQFYDNYYAHTARAARWETMNAMNANAVESIQAGITMIQVLQGKKTSEHLLDCVRGLNERRLYQVALSTRALVETVGHLVTVEAKISGALANGIRTQAELSSVLEIMDMCIRGSRFTWAMWLDDQKRQSLMKSYAESIRKGEEPKPEMFQTNALTFVNQLDKRISSQTHEDNAGLVRLVYGLLTDICHPAAGSNLFQLANELDDQWWIVDSEVSDDMFRWYCLMAVTPFIERVCGAARASLNQLANLCKTMTMVSPN